MTRYFALLLLALAAACNARPPAEPREASPPLAERQPAEPLRLAVVDDPAFGQALVLQWQAHAREAVELVELTSQQAESEPLRADAVVFPSRLLGRLVVDKQIIPWPEDTRGGSAASPTAADEYRWDDVFPWLRRRELRWGETLYGVSFGSPQLMLVYRSDLLTQWQLVPPETWEEYERLRGAIQERLGGDESLPRYATLEPLAPGWAARVLLARAAAYVQHPNQYSTLFQFTTMEPWIDHPPFVRALEELASAVGTVPHEARSLAPNEALARLMSGEAVMAITWPAAGGDTRPAVPEGATFAIAPLPGAEQVYSMSAREWEPRTEEAGRRVPLLASSGLIGAVTRAARSPQAARNLLSWLTQPDVSARLAGSSRSTTMFRYSHAAEPQRWVDTALAPIAGQYADVLLDSQQQPSAMLMLRIPKENRYLESLDEAVQAAVDGQAAAAEALGEVARKWRELTDELGRERQQQAYEASLGLSF